MSNKGEHALPTWLLTCRVDEGTKTRYVKTEQPSWDQIETAIRELDGRHRTELVLYPVKDDDGRFIAVGGGRDDRVVVSVSLSPDTELEFLVDENQPETGFAQFVGGQETPLPGKYNVSEELAIRVVRNYFQTQHLDPSVSWEK